MAVQEAAELSLEAQFGRNTARLNRSGGANQNPSSASSQICYVGFFVCACLLSGPDVLTEGWREMVEMVDWLDMLEYCLSVFMKPACRHPCPAQTSRDLSGGLEAAPPLPAHQPSDPPTLTHIPSRHPGVEVVCRGVVRSVALTNRNEKKTGGSSFAAGILRRLTEDTLWRDGPCAKRAVADCDFLKKSFSLVLDVVDYDNDTSKLGGELIDQVLLSSMLNPGDQWQYHKHHGPALTLEYRLRFRCDSNYYGPLCNKFCRARDDFFGHFACEPSGTKICKDGWTGPECLDAVCKQGCHQTHGSCTVPGECTCHYGWDGPLCDQCVTFPGCMYGTCSEPWKCVCDVNWGGLLCDKDLNTCGNHQPCQNGGTCANTEPNEYQCECQDGFRGRNCDIVEHACLLSPCKNGATCVEDPTGFSCVCTDGWTGHTCANVVKQCNLSSCGPGATCQESPDGFRCLCPSGWMGRTCQLDTNECEGGICVHAQSCRNLIGGYLCICLPGWSGPNCDIRNNSCHGLCLNGGRCQDLVSGSNCVCLPGFTGKYCQTAAGACDSTPCLNGGQCVERDGQEIVCDCPLGYSGSFCEVVIDLCNPNPCQEGVPCRSVEGTYMCVCPDGFYTNKCLSMDPCIGQHCPGAILDSVRGGGLSFYMVLVGVSALATVCCCAACAFLLSHLHRRRKRKQTQGAPPAQGAINNQREFVTLIRNVERPFPLLPPPPPPPGSATQHDPASRCRYEEIELTLPPSPAPSQSSPALKPHAPKQDISNLEREKLNRFHYTDNNQELEV
ncbi:Protein jagged-1b [Merluccius polli]|uniref:Delta-like protein n=1 Tax=Merluccius polli TaxID=89951 RepID=A0AA47MC70_MERPO|nr:Protein jagged-1b [Merluccius polli]